MCRELSELARLAAAGSGEGASIDHALDILENRLAASNVWLIYGAEDEFHDFGTSDCQLDELGLWSVNRALTSWAGGPCGFDLRDGHVSGFHEPQPERACEYIASLAPNPNTNAQMILAKGPWPDGVSPSVTEFLTAAGPAVGRLLERRIDFGFAQKERYRLSALMNITQAVSASENLEDVLSDIAVTIATVTNMDYVTIDIVDDRGQVELRCVNYRDRTRVDRPPDPWRDLQLRVEDVWREVMRSGRSIAFPDAQNDTRLPSSIREFMARTLVRSSAVLPLVTKEDVIGLLTVASVRPTEFGDAELELLEGLASQVAAAAKGIALYRELAASRAELDEKSRQLEQALKSEREQARKDILTGVLNHGAVTEELRELLSQGRVPLAVAMIDVDGMKAVNDTYGHLAGDDVLISVAQSLSSEGGIVGRYGGDEFLIVWPGVQREQAERNRDALLAKLADKRVVDPDTKAAIPLVISIGLAFYPDEAETVTDLIKLSDSAMYSAKWARLHARGTSSRGDERTARIIGELIPLLTSPGEIADKLGLVSRRLAADAGYDAVDCQIFPSTEEPPIAEATAGDRELRIARAWEREQQRPTRQRNMRAILKRTRRPLILEQLGTDERLSEVERTLLSGAGLNTAIVAPMFSGDELIGILSVARKEPNAFTASDAQFVAAVANQVTAIVQMSTLVDRLQIASVRLAGAQAETVMMLAAAAEAHDRTTGLHLLSIRTLSEALARELDYSDQEVEELGLAAVLHDIGKISIPDTILSSPRRFDTDDWDAVQMWEKMKQHSIRGEEFLTGRPGFELAKSIARWHHERWDGSGYPDGLVGEEIPECVAIVTVADALDAMISDRPYREGRSLDAAVAEIAAWSGRQFSPTVVAALVRLHRRGAVPVQQNANRAA